MPENVFFKIMTLNFTAGPKGLTKSPVQQLEVGGVGPHTF